MECPKCRSKNIYFTRVNRFVNPRGEVRITKRYTCLKCGHNFDFI